MKLRSKGVFLLCVSALSPLFVWLPTSGASASIAQPAYVAEIFRLKVFEEPLVPIGDTPSAGEAADLKSALNAYSSRKGPNDFSAIETFIKNHSESPWNAALLTDLGIECYNTAHYSLALDAWGRAWGLAKDATDMNGRAIADRAVGELAYMYARLGRARELQGLLSSVEGRVFTGQSTEKIAGAREALSNMQEHPEVSFRCGPLALRQIRLATDPKHPIDDIIYNAASTRKGFSLTQVAELSDQAGLNYQMGKRSQNGEFVVPSVVHWNVGHYAALVRKDGDKYLLQDPTFGNTVWATRAALETETSGYFLIPSGPLPKGWRGVDKKEGDKVFGKGVTSNNDPKPFGPGDPSPPPQPCKGMATSRVHFMLVNLHLDDEPVGYSPPLGPSVHFTMCYNHRDSFQPAIFSYSNFGSKWTCYWISYINDNPQSPTADVNYYMPGGGVRTFAYNSGTQGYNFEAFDHTLLKKTGTTTYELTFPNGSKYLFAKSDGATGTSRKIFLTQVFDASGNSVTLNYDGNVRLTSISDAIGQSTTISYSNGADIYKITQVTDPFGRFAMFNYDTLGRLTNITDVIGMSSQFAYETNGDFINSLTTPYGTTSFTRGGTGTTRWLETLYPDQSRERVEYNQDISLYPNSEPASQVPQGMLTANQFLYGRNTYYWTRNACALAYGDYSKARIYHWLHTADGSSTSGVIESIKNPLESRIWYNYSGQSQGNFVGLNNLPVKIGRVLDDGTTQLYQYGYDGFGHVTNSIDPVGRTFSYIYSTNGIDLLEGRMTRAGKNELLFRKTYNAQHQPETAVDTAGQTNSFTYNARGQLFTETNPKSQTTTYNYDPNGYLLSVDGPLPGTNDTSSATYDSFGRVKTKTDASGYTITLAYDALDRVTTITHPDNTYEQFTYDRKDLKTSRDRAGRLTSMDYNAIGQLTKRIDPLNRTTIFQWCTCGDLKSLTDPLGRTTQWDKDVEGRLKRKVYNDGSQRLYSYEASTSRLRQLIDEKLQVQLFTFNADNSLQFVAYANCASNPGPVTYSYDPDYKRLKSMSDAAGTASFEYFPIGATPALGAGHVSRIVGPHPNSVVQYEYDELGRAVATSVDGAAERVQFDAAGRVMSETNLLGIFGYSYDGPTRRLVSIDFPNGQKVLRQYDDLGHDFALKSITNEFGTTPISTFGYETDTPRRLITQWSQQAGNQAPDVYSLNYDAGSQLLGATVTNSGVLARTFAYSYDAAANRLTEQAGALGISTAYNALNQIDTCSGCTNSPRTNFWDAKDQLVATETGSQRAVLGYDGKGHLDSIRELTNGVTETYRFFTYAGDRLVEERDATGTITKRFFPQGVQLVTGPNAGNYYYTRDHLGSIHELVDSSGTVRARYSYDPYGRRTKVSGNMDADFGFAGMLWEDKAGIAIARFRSYDPNLGRWLSRDPLRDAERKQGPNLYAYVNNNPVMRVDPLGLSPSGCCGELANILQQERGKCKEAQDKAASLCQFATQYTPEVAAQRCAQEIADAADTCMRETQLVAILADAYFQCVKDNNCAFPPCPPKMPRFRPPFGGGGPGPGPGDGPNPAPSGPGAPTPEPPPGDDCNGMCITSSTGRPAERMAADTEATAGTTADHEQSDWGH